MLTFFKRFTLTAVVTITTVVTTANLCAMQSANLSDAVISGNVSDVNGFIARGVNVNEVLAYGAYSRNWTYLHKAAYEGKVEIAQALINAGANVNALDLMSCTALMLAIEHRNHPDIVESLINAGADVNIRDLNGRTALSIATNNDGYVDIVKTILAAPRITQETIQAAIQAAGRSHLPSTNPCVQEIQRALTRFGASAAPSVAAPGPLVAAAPSSGDISSFRVPIFDEDGLIKLSLPRSSADIEAYYVTKITAPFENNIAYINQPGKSPEQGVVYLSKTASDVLQPLLSQKFERPTARTDYIQALSQVVGNLMAKSQELQQAGNQAGAARYANWARLFEEQKQRFAAPMLAPVPTAAPVLARPSSPRFSPAEYTGQHTPPRSELPAGPSSGKATAINFNVSEHAALGTNPQRRMEDASAIVDTPTHLVAAIYDGHGGESVAVRLKERLIPAILSHIGEIQIPKSNPNYSQQVAHVIQTTFVEIDGTHFRVDLSGSCAVLVIVDKFTNIAYFVNLGDSRAILVDRGQNVRFSTRDQKPNDPEEEARIQANGRFVSHGTPSRVNGQLAVARAFGDAQFKPAVSAEPVVNAIQLQPTDKFIVLACDGIWDVMRNEEVANFVFDPQIQGQARAALRQLPLYLSNDPWMNPRLQAALRQDILRDGTIAGALVDQALVKDSQDNCSAIVIELRPR